MRIISQSYFLRLIEIKPFYVMLLDFRLAIVGPGAANLMPGNSDLAQEFNRYFNPNRAGLLQGDAPPLHFSRRTNPILI